ncbi:hypothetical protein A3C96_04200 [Candidatus Uhrbacteria bacterium RIFCSPHIGHO2_02_FULL_60_10]|uniref:Uncharacterized protein n=1 Tax=Candidatus Uhrbacteria bacterium RIFCSPHIGHO2_02_FULL_60_10 TaxID=1802392 RepID=A0A1F7U8P7_9BACT|nr:MAG: hypothetical protein A3C96_04200 [Candidatus Uhrbacteria bacterium RIFCSPHIGHO2_02_FULL_60_10]
MQSDVGKHPAPELPPPTPETEPGELTPQKAPLDIRGLVRDAGAIRRLKENEANTRKADEAQMRAVITGALSGDRDADDGVEEELAIREKLEKEKEGIAKKLCETHGINPAKKKLTLGERLKWLMSGDVRQSLQRYRELDRAHAETERRMRILERALKPKTEEERARSRKLPPEVSM